MLTVAIERAKKNLLNRITAGPRGYPGKNADASHEKGPDVPPLTALGF